MGDSLFQKKHSSRTFAYIAFIILLCLLDALFTSFLIAKGASEINPVMAFFLQFGHTTFIAAKYSITVISLIIILIAGKKLDNRFGPNTLFKVIAGLFCLVILWELYLIARIFFR